MKTWQIVVASIVGVILIVVVPMGVWAFRVATADIKGRGDAQIKTHGADYRIAAYNHFTDLCAAVQAKEDQIHIQHAELNTGHIDAFRQQQLLTNITALRSARVELIRQYNGDASKDYTTGDFRDSDLPYQLNPNEGTTTCAL